MPLIPIQQVATNALQQHTYTDVRMVKLALIVFSHLAINFWSIGAFIFLVTTLERKPEEIPQGFALRVIYVTTLFYGIFACICPAISCLVGYTIYKQRKEKKPPSVIDSCCV